MDCASLYLTLFCFIEGKRRLIGCQITDHKINEDIMKIAKRTKKFKIVLPYFISVDLRDIFMSKNINLCLYILSSSY